MWGCVWGGGGGGHSVGSTPSFSFRLSKQKSFYVCVSLCRKVNSVDRVIELTGLDHKCLREAQGRTLLEDERQKVREGEGEKELQAS